MPVIIITNKRKAPKSTYVAVAIIVMLTLMLIAFVRFTYTHENTEHGQKDNSANIVLFIIIYFQIILYIGFSLLIFRSIGPIQTTAERFMWNVNDTLNYVKTEVYRINPLNK